MATYKEKLVKAIDDFVNEPFTCVNDIILEYLITNIKLKIIVELLAKKKEDTLFNEILADLEKIEDKVPLILNKL